MSAPVLVALLCVYVFWGSTYAAMHLAVASIPAFAMSAMRFLIAGTIMYGVAAAFGQKRPSRDELKNAAIAGATLILFGNGITAWCVHYLPTGIASLLVSLAAVWMAVFDYLLVGARVTRLAIGGMALAMIGLGLVVVPRVDAALPAFPTAAVLFASVAWGFGSIYARRFGGSDRLLLKLALQMLCGGAFLAIFALITGDWSRLHFAAITAASFGGFAWLIVFGSIVGYGSFLYLMKHAPTTLGSTYAYVNPVVAVMLGIALFHERIAPVAFAGGAVIVLGVACMMLPPRTSSSRRETKVPQPQAHPANTVPRG